MKPIRINSIEVSRYQLAYVAEVWFRTPTRQQFTDEAHTARAAGRRGWFGPIGFLTAVLAGYRAARKEAARLQSLDGPYDFD